MSEPLDYTKVEEDISFLGDRTVRKFCNVLLNDARNARNEAAEARSRLAQAEDDHKKNNEAWNELYKRATAGLMILHDRKDLVEAAGVTIGSYLADAVPYIVRRLDEAEAALRWLTTPIPGEYEFRLIGYWSDGEPVMMSPDNEHLEAARRAHSAAGEGDKEGA